MIYILIVFILSLLDVVSTHIGLRISYQIYGNAWYAVGEANPYMDGVIQHWWGVVLKVFIALSGTVILVIIKERYVEKQIQVAFWLGFTFIVLVHLAAIVWNTTQILIMRGVIN